MEAVQSHIRELQQRFSEHRFFRRQETPASGHEVIAGLPLLTFWVSTFQDILAVNENRFADPTMRKIARLHRQEDAGHDRWFFEDLQTLGIALPNAKSLFGRENAQARHASFSLMGEVYRARNDVERLVLLLTLESSGHIFFERIAAFLERIGFGKQLKYFSHFHLDIEHNHDLFEEEVKAYLKQLVLPEETREECITLVNRAYRSFFAMFDAVDDACDAATAAEKPLPAPAPVVTA